MISGFIAHRIQEAKRKGHEYTIATRSVRDLMDGKTPVGMYGAQLANMFQNMDLDTIKRVVFVGVNPGYEGAMQNYHTSVQGLEETLAGMGDLKDVAVVHVRDYECSEPAVIINKAAGGVEANHDLVQIAQSAGKSSGKDVSRAYFDSGYVNAEVESVYQTADRMGAKAVSILKNKGDDLGEMIGYMMAKL